MLTNGGGKHETEKAADLSATLGVTIPESLYIQSHTPYRDMAASYANKTVLAIAQDPCKGKEILQRYGFSTVVTTGDLHHAAPDLWPFQPLPAGKPHHAPCSQPPLPAPVRSLRIDAVFVINDPAYWQLDLQILMDLLVSQGGVLGTVSARNGDASLPNAGWHQDGQPPIFFSASDLEFASAWPVPRFGQGSFIAALKGIWAAKTGPAATSAAASFGHTIIGKPTHSQYEYVENRQRELNEAKAAAAINGSSGSNSAAAFRCPPFRRNYMIGDNPESDIRGALNHQSRQGTKWLGVLVETGVWDGKGTPSVEPSYYAKDVRAAVELIGRLEGHALTVKVDRAGPDGRAGQLGAGAAAASAGPGPSFASQPLMPCCIGTWARLLLP